MDMDVNQAVDAMLRAIEENDAEAMRASSVADLSIWHNFDDAKQDREDNVALLSGISLLGRAKYHILERFCVGNRVIQRHELTIATHDGSRVYRLDAAIFITMRDGKVATVEEYADSRQVAEIGAAIQQAHMAKAHEAAVP